MYTSVITTKISLRYFQSKVKLSNGKTCTDIVIIYNISWQTLYNYLNSMISVSILRIILEISTLYNAKLTRLMKKVKIEFLFTKLTTNIVQKLFMAILTFNFKIYK